MPNILEMIGLGGLPPEIVSMIEGYVYPFYQVTPTLIVQQRDGDIEFCSQCECIMAVKDDALQFALVECEQDRIEPKVICPACRTKRAGRRMPAPVWSHSQSDDVPFPPAKKARLRSQSKASDHLASYKDFIRDQIRDAGNDGVFQTQVMVPLKYRNYIVDQLQRAKYHVDVLDVTQWGKRSGEVVVKLNIDWSAYVE